MSSLKVCVSLTLLTVAWIDVSVVYASTDGHSHDSSELVQTSLSTEADLHVVKEQGPSRAPEQVAEVSDPLADEHDATPAPITGGGSPINLENETGSVDIWTWWKDGYWKERPVNEQLGEAAQTFDWEKAGDWAWSIFLMSLPFVIFYFLGGYWFFGETETGVPNWVLFVKGGGSAIAVLYLLCLPRLRAYGFAGHGSGPSGEDWVYGQSVSSYINSPQATGGMACAFAYTLRQMVAARPDFCGDNLSLVMVVTFFIWISCNVEIWLMIFFPAHVIFCISGILFHSMMLRKAEPGGSKTKEASCAMLIIGTFAFYALLACDVYAFTLGMVMPIWMATSPWFFFTIEVTALSCWALWMGLRDIGEHCDCKPWKWADYVAATADEIVAAPVAAADDKDEKKKPEEKSEAKTEEKSEEKSEDKGGASEAPVAEAGADDDDGSTLFTPFLTIGRRVALLPTDIILTAMMPIFLILGCGNPLDIPDPPPPEGEKGEAGKEGEPEYKGYIINSPWPDRIIVFVCGASLFCILFFILLILCAVIYGAVTHHG